MEQRLLEYLDAAENALAEYGPQAAEGILLWARIDAASGLIAPLVIALVLVAAATQWPRFYRWAKADWFERDTPFYVLSAMASIPGVIGAIACLIELLNIWRWVGIFAPEMWLVHKAISAVTT